MVTYHFQDHERSWQSDVHAARMMGFNVLRIDAVWSRIEPRNGRFVFLELDDFIEVAKRGGVKLYIIVSTHLYPDWAERYLRRRPLRFIEEAVEFTEVLTRHVTEKYPDVVSAWQVENEPWEIGPPASMTHNLPTDEKVLYLRGIIDAIRKVDSESPLVLTTNMEWNRVISELETAGASMLLDSIDVFGLNLYPYWDGLRGESSEAVEYLNQILEDGLAQAENHGKELWVVEIPVVPYYSKQKPHFQEAVEWLSLVLHKTQVIGIYQLRGGEFGILQFPRISRIYHTANLLFLARLQPPSTIPPQHKHWIPELN